MDLLERAAPLAALDDLLTASATGGHVAVISGEAGAGKSALAGAFAERSGGRARVYWGACDPLLTPRALGPLHDIARQAGGALRELVADRPRDRVFDALIDLLDVPPRAARPVLIVEDVHWADEATLDMVAFLGRRLSRFRALLVLTYRDDEVGPAHQLRAVLAGLPRPALRRLSLKPLSVAAVADLAERAGRSPAHVYEVTGGNALLVTEVLATDQRVPATVRDLVLSRLAALSDAGREVAGLVAVLPTRAEAALLGGRAEAVEECLAGGVLTVAGDGVAYRHELLRRAVEEALSPVRRAALHAEVLAALAGRSWVDPARLVHHAHHAGDAAAVLRWAPVAAGRAAAVGAYRQAAAHYATALPLAGEFAAADRAGLLEAYGLAAYHGGLTVDALAAYREALALRESLGDRPRIGDDLRWVSRLTWWLGQTGEAMTAIGSAIEVLAGLPDRPGLAAAQSQRASLLMLSDRDTEAIEQGTLALELARETGDVTTAAHSLIAIGTARMYRNYPTGRDELEEAHASALAIGADDPAARALVNLACMATDWLDLATASETLDRVLSFTHARDLDGYTRHLLGYQARLHMLRGDFSTACDLADQAIVGTEMPGGALVLSLAVRGAIRGRRGQEGALDDVRLAAERGHGTGETQFVAPGAIALAEHLWLTGDVDRAAAEAKRGLEVVEPVGQPWMTGELAFWLWRCGRLSEAPALVATPYRLLIRGDWRGAAEEWEARGCPYDRAEALSHGDADACAFALRVFDGLGAVARADRLRRDLRDRGLRVPRGPRASTSADPTGLTARQREVLGLIGEGLSNAQIAARLHLSAKTVDHHVSAILTKLGVRSRTAAVLKMGRSTHD
ncbi:AAA family ATPase [Actinoplanes sp. NPDC089786]|uniref:ATP-binding protein n=1 Tax=Actinoplanes sp. NPDC089786 TaxID=3155185 RepID=UPI00343A2208